MAKRKDDYLIKDTHRGLLYRDGAFQRVLGAGRHRFPVSLWTRAFAESSILALAFSVVVLAPIGEELIFRRFAFATLRAGAGRGLAPTARD